MDAVYKKRDLVDRSGKQESTSSRSTCQAERRKTERLNLTATADVIELASGMRCSSRTTDLGQGGCFVDTLVPFPVNSKVHIGIRKGHAKFETVGVVVYSQTGLGMGIAFDENGPEQRPSFNAWLDDLTAWRQPLTGTLPEPQKPSSHLSNLSALIRLVQLLIEKGFLTEAEGSSIL